jgi:hypothetical protein
MILSRKGMNVHHHDKKISLEDRFQYSKNLANWINSTDDDELEEIQKITNNYFKECEKHKIDEADIFEYSKHGHLRNWKLWAYNVILAPFALLGLIHGWISWFIIKPKVEKLFKRKVFWSSVKIVLSHFITGLYNLLLIIPLYLFVYPSVLLWLLYLLLFSGPSFIIFWNWQNNLKILKRRRKMDEKDLKHLFQLRAKTIEKLNHRVPNF